MSFLGTRSSFEEALASPPPCPAVMAAVVADRYSPSHKQRRQQVDGDESQHSTLQDNDNVPKQDKRQKQQQQALIDELKERILRTTPIVLQPADQQPVVVVVPKDNNVSVCVSPSSISSYSSSDCSESVEQQSLTSPLLNEIKHTCSTDSDSFRSCSSSRRGDAPSVPPTDRNDHTEPTLENAEGARVDLLTTELFTFTLPDGATDDPEDSSKQNDSVEQSRQLPEETPEESPTLKTPEPPTAQPETESTETPIGHIREREETSFEQPAYRERVIPETATATASASPVEEQLPNAADTTEEKEQTAPTETATDLSASLAAAKSESVAAVQRKKEHPSRPLEETDTEHETRTATTEALPPGPRRDTAAKRREAAEERQAAADPSETTTKEHSSLETQEEQANSDISPEEIAEKDKESQPLKDWVVVPKTTDSGTAQSEEQRSPDTVESTTVPEVLTVSSDQTDSRHQEERDSTKESAHSVAKPSSDPSKEPQQKQEITPATGTSTIESSVTQTNEKQLWKLEETDTVTTLASTCCCGLLLDEKVVSEEKKEEYSDAQHIMKKRSPDYEEEKKEDDSVSNSASKNRRNAGGTAASATAPKAPSNGSQYDGTKVATIPAVQAMALLEGSPPIPGFQSRKKLSDYIRLDLWKRDDPGTVKNALLALAEAAEGPGARGAIARAGGLFAIVRSMEDNGAHAGVQIAACRALEKLALDPENELAIAEIGGVDAVLGAMMGHFQNAAVHEAAWSTLWNLSCLNAASRMTIDTAGGMGALVSCMAAHVNEPTVQKNACGALANLCLNNEDRLEALSEAGGFVAITTALQKHWKNPEVRYEASNALSALLEQAPQDDECFWQTCS